MTSQGRRPGVAAHTEGLCLNNNNNNNNKIPQTHFSVDMDEYFQTSANFIGSNSLCLVNYIAVYALF